MNRRIIVLVSVAVIAITAGCIGGSTDRDPTPEPTIDPTSEPTSPTPETPEDSPTPTSEPDPTSTPDPTPTPTPTSTPTPTPTPEPTPEPTQTPETDIESGNVGEFIEGTHDGQRFRVQFEGLRAREEISTEDGTLEAPGDTQWVIADVWIVNDPGDDIRIGYSQWSVEDFQDVEHKPDDEAMRRAVGDQWPSEDRLGGNEEARFQVIWALEYTNDLEFYMEPYGPQDGTTIRIERQRL